MDPKYGNFKGIFVFYGKIPFHFVYWRGFASEKYVDDSKRPTVKMQNILKQKFIYSFEKYCGQSLWYFLPSQYYSLIISSVVVEHSFWEYGQTHIFTLVGGTEKDGGGVCNWVGLFGFPHYFLIHESRISGKHQMGSVAIVKFSRAICDNPVSQDEQIYKLLFHMNSVQWSDV